MYRSKFKKIPPIALFDGAVAGDIVVDVCPPAAEPLPATQADKPATVVAAPYTTPQQWNAPNSQTEPGWKPGDVEADPVEPLQVADLTTGENWQPVSDGNDKPTWIDVPDSFDKPATVQSTSDQSWAQYPSIVESLPAEKDLEIEEAPFEVDKAFTNGGIFNRWTHVNPQPNGDLELIIGHAFRSENGTLWQDAETFGHNLSLTINGEVLNDHHLFEWQSRAEYLSMYASFSPAEWAQFTGAVFAGYDPSGTNNFIFNDNQGGRFGQSIGGGWEQPNDSSGPNYAPWDESDGDENFNERLPVIMGGVLANGDPSSELGQLHDVLDGTPWTDGGNQSLHAADAAFYITRVTLGAPEMLMDNSANLITEAREDGTLNDPIQFLSGTTVSVGSNMAVSQFSLPPMANFDPAQQTVSFNSSSVSSGVNAMFSHTIAADGAISVTAVSGKPSGAHLEQYLAGFEMSFTPGSQDQPDLVNLAGTATIVTTDVFGFGNVLADQASVEITIFDRPDSTPGIAGAGIGSGHSDIPDTIDMVALEAAVGSTDVAHAVVVEGKEPINYAERFSTQSRDDAFRHFDINVDQPHLFFVDGQVNPIVNYTQPTIPGVTAQLIDTGSSVFWRLTSTDTNPLSAADVNAFVQGQTLQLVAEDAEPLRLTFSYSWIDLAGNADQSIDGYLGDKPDNPDFGRTVVVLVPVNDAPIVEIGGDASACVAAAIEGGDSVMPLADLSINDIDSTYSQSAVIAFAEPLPENIVVEFSSAAQAIIDANDLTVSITREVVEIDGDALISDYREVLAGLTVTNPDNPDDVESTVEISMTVTLLDISSSGLNDHLSGDDAVCFQSTELEEPKPDDPKVPVSADPEKLANRHIIDEEELVRLASQLHPEADPAQQNVHIHLLVNGLNNLLDAQTMNTSNLLVHQMTDEVRAVVQDFKPLGTPDLQQQLITANERVQAGFIQSALKTVSIGNSQS